MRNSLPRIYPAIALAVAVAGVLVWLALGRGGSDRPAPAPHGHEHEQHEHTHAPAQPAPAPALPAAASDDGHAHDDTGHQDDLDPLADTAELPAPPAEDEIAPRPEPAPLTAEDRRTQRQASIDLLDRSIERLEAEQKAAEASGDTRTAERNRIRVARMRERRAALAAEPQPSVAPARP